MRITKRQLKQIIREEKAKLIKESSREAAINFHRGEMNFGDDDEIDDGPSMFDWDDYDRLVRQIDKIINNFTNMGYTREDVLHALNNVLEEI